MQVPVFGDGVVLLTAHELGDIPDHVAGEDEETARRFGWWPRSSTAADVQAAYAGWAEQWAVDGPTRAFAVREASGQRLVGGCELRLQADGSGHVSYWTHASERRKGYAGRALRLLCEYADSVGVARLESHVAHDNTSSRLVCQRASFVESGTFLEQETVMVRYVRRTPAAQEVH
ncbi:MAG: GNAT family N-acetyltransferase [Geodermatophilaceae bacterium]